MGNKELVEKVENILNKAAEARAILHEAVQETVAINNGGVFGGALLIAAGQLMGAATCISGTVEFIGVSAEAMATQKREEESANA